MNALFWIATCLLASLPWTNHKVFGVYGSWPKRTRKPIWLVLLESVTLYSLAWFAMFFAEAKQGVNNPQGWQFWVIVACMWVVLAFPVMAWFKLRKQ